MRALFGLLAVAGLAGIAFGVLTMIGGADIVPFRYEDYGGPGAIIGGLLLFSVGLYLLVVWPRIESHVRAGHRS
jgi:hypothetical protein